MATYKFDCIGNEHPNEDKTFKLELEKTAINVGNWTAKGEHSNIFFTETSGNYKFTSGNENTLRLYGKEEKPQARLTAIRTDSPKGHKGTGKADQKGETFSYKLTDKS